MKFKARTNAQRQLETRWDLVNTYLSRWKPGTFLDVEITRRKKTESDPMRKYYYGVVLPGLMKATGYEPEEKDMVHLFLKGIYFQCEQDERGIYRGVPSVFGKKSEITTDKKWQFIEWVVRKAAEYGEYVPLPDE